MAPSIQVLDLEFQGIPQAIASFLVRGPAGSVLVETGPMSTLGVLRRRLAAAGIAEEEIGQVLVTHIHLDHSGAAGWWAQRGATVYVHPRGAPHLVDPARLLSSAERIYGDRMDALWGKTVAAPAERVIAIEDGAEVMAGGLTFRALATPGHAWHHHAWWLDGALFAGDAAGIRIPGCGWLDLPAPPPEFELEVWRETLDRLRKAAPDALYRTHFGASSEIAAELDRFEEMLNDGARFIRRLVESGVERDEMVERYLLRVRDLAAAAGVGDEVARAYEVANPRQMSVDGILRYWRKKLQD